MYNINPKTRELLFLSKQLKVNRKFTEGINFNPSDTDFNGWHLLNQDGDLIAVTPLFNFDEITTENEKNIINNNVVISDINEIGDNIIVKSNNNQNVLIYDSVILVLDELISANNEVFLVLRVFNEYADVLSDIPIELYYTEDDETFSLIKTFKTDVNGKITYFADQTGGYKFKYDDNTETEVIYV